MNEWSGNTNEQNEKQIKNVIKHVKFNVKQGKKRGAISNNENGQNYTQSKITN